MTTLPEFYDMLRHFDWHFEMLDDHRVWSAGNRRQAELNGLLRLLAKHHEPRHQRSW